MSREIKFRCWNGKKMLRVDELVIDPDGKASCYGFDTKWEDGDDPRKWVSDGIFMQYTGLKDRNGKEIYEGDIVRCDKAEWYRSEILFGKDISSLPEYQEVVTFDYELLNMRKNDYENHWVVVGNVYENPELLNV